MRLLPGVFAVASILALPSVPAFAEDDAGNWKLGRIYYRASCTSCHTAELGEAISPASMTMDEWRGWIETDNGAAHFSEFTSQAYRSSIAGENKVAEKFASLPDREMWDHTRAFVIYGAKDSPNPATCN
jgi:hypothetical protein